MPVLVVDAVHVANTRQEYEKCLHGKFPLICLRTVNGNDESTCRDYRLRCAKMSAIFSYKVFYVIAHRTPNVACARLINKSPPHTSCVQCHQVHSTHKYHFICIIYMWAEFCFFICVEWFIYIQPIKNAEVWRCLIFAIKIQTNI